MRIPKCVHADPREASAAEYWFWAKYTLSSSSAITDWRICKQPTHLGASLQVSRVMREKNGAGHLAICQQ